MGFRSARFVQSMAIHRLQILRILYPGALFRPKGGICTAQTVLNRWFVNLASIGILSQRIASRTFSFW